MDRDKKVPDQDPDATINEITGFDADATISDANAFDPNATIEQTANIDPNATVQDAAELDPGATIEKTAHFDADATIEKTVEFDPNATIEEADEFDPDATLEVDDHFDANATIEHSGTFDANATIEATGNFSIDLGAAPGTGEEGSGSVLNDSNLNQTINPRALSSAEAKYWAEMSAEFTSPNDPTIQPSVVDRTIVETKLQLRSQTVATQIHSDGEAADYRLVRLLGRGGMGNVFVARQGSLDRLIAVKVIRPLDESKRKQLAENGQLESVEQGRRQQFLTEAVVTGDLDHPNIVPIHDVALTGDSTLFYSMKRVIGTPWSDVIGEKTQEENLEILIKVADAIGFAHTRGVVHRDIKPENVMLGDFGVVMVMDWGIALAKPNFEKLDSITPATGLGGTPSMMAPEMATGPLEKVGPAADIYLLGATLFMIVTGKPPHHAPNVSQCLRAVANNDICEFDPKHQGELMNIALKAMSLDPADRYAETTEFQNAIRKYRSHAESIALVKRAEDDLRIACKERSYTSYTRAQFGFEEALALWPGNEAAQSGLEQAKFSHAEAAHQNEDYDLGLKLLDEQNPQHTELVESLKLSLQQRRQRETRFAVLKKVAAALLAFILIGGSVAIVVINQARTAAMDQKQRADENARIAMSNARTADENADIAEDNARIAESNAVTAQQNAERAKLAQAKAEYEAYVSGVGLAKARIDRNEFTEARRLIQELIAQQGGGKVPWELRYLSSLANQSTGSLSTTTGVGGLAVAGNPGRPVSGIPAIIRLEDGTLTAITVVANADQPIVVDTPRPVRLPDGEHASCIAINDDETLAAAGTEKGDILLFDPRALGEATLSADLQFRRFQGHRGRVTTIEMIGKDYLVSASDDRTVRIWNLNQPTDREILWHIASVVDIACSNIPDGFRIVAGVADKALGRVVVWDIQTGEKLQSERRGVFTEHPQSVTSVAVSPDGQIAASGDVDGRVMLWPVSQLQQRDVERLVKQAVDAVSEAGANGPLETTRPTASDSEPMTFTQLNNPETVTPESEETSPPAPAHRSSVRHIEFSADGQSLLTCGDDYLIQLWRMEPIELPTTPPAGRLQRTLRGHGGVVTDARFLTPNGDQVLSVGKDDSIRLWRSGVESAPSSASVLVGQQAAGHAPPGITASDALSDLCATLIVHDPILSHVHDDWISSAILSANGQQVVTASRDRTARVLTIDPSTLQLRTAVEIETADAPTRASTSSNAPESPIISLDEGTDFRAMSMNNNRSANKLFIGGADAVVRIWDLGRGTESGTISGTGLNQVLAVSDDSRVILTGSSDPETRVILWRFDPQTSIAVAQHRLAGHQEAVTAAAVDAGGRRALTADRAGRIILWDVQTGTSIGKPIDLLLGTRINDIAVAPDGDTVWGAADDERLSQLDLNSRELIDRLDHDGIVTSVKLSGDGRRAVTSSKLQKVDSTIHHAVLWQLPLETKPAAFQTIFTQHVKTDDRTRSGGSPGIASVAIDEPGEHAYIAVNPPGDAPARVERWRAADDIRQSTKEIAMGLPKRLGDVSAAAPAGSDQLVTLHGHSAYRWNTATRGLEVSYRIHGAISVAAISPDGEIVLTGSQSLKAWDAHTGLALGKLESPHGKAVRCIEFVGDTAPHDFFTGGADGSIRRWAFQRDTPSFTELGKLSSVESVGVGEMGIPLSLSISPDGHQLLSTTDRGHVILHNLTEQTQQVLFADPDVGSIFAGCFSPDGRFVAAGGDDQLARMWDLSKQHVPADPPDAIFQGHAEAIHGVALIGAAPVAGPQLDELEPSANRSNPDGPNGFARVSNDSSTRGEHDETLAASSPSTLRLFTASHDRSIRVWDPRFGVASSGTGDTYPMGPTGRELLDLVRHRDGVNSIEFNSDGSLMMTAGRDGNVVLWPACDP